MRTDDRIPREIVIRRTNNGYVIEVDYALQGAPYDEHEMPLLHSAFGGSHVKTSVRSVVRLVSDLLSPEKAIATADEYIATGHVPDIVFFDLPGTVNSEGVINSLAGMDYIFTPISADKVVLESSLSFAMAIQKLLVRNEACRLAGLYVFWNMVDGREKTDLYTAYDKTIKELELPLMKTFIPDTKRYKKELVADKKAVFRSTLFPASRPLVRGSNLEELITEIVYYIKLQ